MVIIRIVISIRRKIYEEIMKKLREEFEYYEEIVKKFEKKYSCPLEELERRIDFSISINGSKEGCRFLVTCPKWAPVLSKFSKLTSDIKC